jgi:hypothetical protein
MVHLKSSLSTLPQQYISAASQTQDIAKTAAKLASNFRKPGPSATSTAQDSTTEDSSSESTAGSFQALFSTESESASQSTTNSTSSQASAAGFEALFGGSQSGSASEQSPTSSTASQPSMDSADTSAPDSGPTVQSVFGSSSPWLSDPTGTSPDGTTFNYNPEYFATPQAAAQVAAMLGGKVVQENQFGPNGSPFGQSASNEMVQMPDGGLINAGLVAAFFTHGYPQSVIDQMIANTIATT